MTGSPADGPGDLPADGPGDLPADGPGDLPADGPGDLPDPDLTVDVRGSRCPLPVIELARRIGEVPVGGVVAVLADDEAARHDVPAWCEMRGHAYLGEPGAHTYLVRRLT